MKNLSNLNLNNKKIIIFDLDGTLIDSIGVWNKTDQKIIEMFGGGKIDIKTIQSVRDNFLRDNQGSDIYIEYCKFIINKYKLNVKDSSELLKTRVNLANEVLSKDIDFKPGSVQLVNLLKQLGFILVLATVTTRRQLNTYTTENKKMISKMNIDDTFDFIISKEDVINKKPDPEIYNKIMNYYNVSSDECLIFEDSYTGVLAGHNAGIEVINVYDKYSDDNRDKINSLSDYYIDNFDEFIDFLKDYYSKRINDNIFDYDKKKII